MALVNRENLNVAQTAFFGLLTKTDIQTGTHMQW